MALTRPAPGEWTYDDLLALPDDGRRWEIIEGVLYEMPPVSWIESATKIGLVLPFFDAVESRGGWMIVSPLWVFLPGAEPVQPDALVVLPGGGSMPSDRGLEGPPDLIVEIVSPPSRGHDLLTKRSLYARAGVREYWQIDPGARTADVLTLSGEGYRAAQHAAGNDVAHSLLLPEVTLDLAALFARLETGPRPA